MAQLLPIAALRGKERSTEALKGDIYTRKWTSTRGKGKKKVEVEHTIHINPITVVVAGAAAAGGALLGMIALHGAGKKAGMSVPKTVRRMVDEYQPVYKDVKVVDSPYVAAIPAHEETGYYTVPNWVKYDVDKNGFRREEAEALGIRWVFHHIEEVQEGTRQASYTNYIDAVPEQLEISHTVPTLVSVYRVIVMSNNFVPHGTYSDLTEALLKMQSRHKNPRELTELRSHWVTIAGKDVLRHFYEFKADGIGVGDTDTSWWPKLDVDLFG